LIGFELYTLEGLLWSWKFKLFPKLASYRSSSQEISKGWLSSSLGGFGFYGIDGLGFIDKSWDWSDCDLAIKTSSSCLGDNSFSSSGIS
jgi:hypothetical protein